MRSRVVGTALQDPEGRSLDVSRLPLPDVEGPEEMSGPCGCVGWALGRTPAKRLSYALLHAEGVQVGRIASDESEADQVYSFLYHESPSMREDGTM